MICQEFSCFRTFRLPLFCNLKKVSRSYFEYEQLKMEIFLEAICNLLSSGDASNIFDAEEKAEICERMRKIDRQVQNENQ